MHSIEVEIDRAAEAISQSEALVIGAGAGMGVDSGLPDFRGDKGFWTAYPPFRGKSFAEVSNPVWFESDPEQAWGFFGHRLNLYRHTSPHVGFSILLEWALAKPAGYFVFTSNIDGHFQKAGFAADRVVECHGSIHFLQCRRPCKEFVWAADEVEIAVDEENFRATSPMPTCISCGALARPNVVMFGDMACVPRRWLDQQRRYAKWVDSIQGKRTTVIEFGAGKAIPTVRQECEQHDGLLIRVNPRDDDAPDGAVVLPLGALDAIQRIQAARD